MDDITLGQSVRVIVEFSTPQDTLQAVTGVVFQAKNPSGTITNLTVTQTAPGVHSGLLTLDVLGAWVIRATCSGPNPAAVEKTFNVITQF